MFVCEKHRSFSIGDALKMQAKNECHVCEITTLRAQLSALREHFGEMSEATIETAVYYDSGETITEWLAKAREILGEE